MAIDNEIAKIAALIGDQTRANILIALMEGRALTAGELALRANISPQTASNHLKKLMEAELIVYVRTPTRYRYYKIASSLVAAALESLSLLTDNVKKAPPRHGNLNQDIRFCRTCYDHLAGELGVRITQSLLKHHFLKQHDESFSVTSAGESFFADLGISINSLQKLRRPIAKPCLDWTEREYHLAGSLGSALLDYFLKQRFMLRSKTKSRVIIPTAEGTLWLNRHLL